MLEAKAGVLLNVLVVGEVQHALHDVLNAVTFEDLVLNALYALSAPKPKILPSPPMFLITAHAEAWNRESRPLARIALMSTGIAPWSQKNGTLSAVRHNATHKTLRLSDRASSTLHPSNWTAPSVIGIFSLSRDSSILFA